MAESSGEKMTEFFYSVSVDPNPMTSNNYLFQLLLNSLCCCCCCSLIVAATNSQPARTATLAGVRQKSQCSVPKVAEPSALAGEGMGMGPSCPGRVTRGEVRGSRPDQSCSKSRENTQSYDQYLCQGCVHVQRLLSINILS